MAMNAAGNIIGIGQAVRQPNGSQPIFPPTGSPAPLPGTDHRQRLMAGGELVPLGAIRAGKLLVKAEWDAAEAWMKAEIDDKEPQ